MHAYSRTLTHVHARARARTHTHTHVYAKQDGLSPLPFPPRTQGAVDAPEDGIFVMPATGRSQPKGGYAGIRETLCEEVFWEPLTTPNGNLFCSLWRRSPLALMSATAWEGEDRGSNVFRIITPFFLSFWPVSMILALSLKHSFFDSFSRCYIIILYVSIDYGDLIHGNQRFKPHDAISMSKAISHMVKLGD